MILDNLLALLINRLRCGRLIDSSLGVGIVGIVGIVVVAMNKLNWTLSVAVAVAVAVAVVSDSIVKI